MTQDLRAIYQAAAPDALAWPWDAGLKAVFEAGRAASAPVASVRCNPDQDPADELACAEAVLDSLSVGLDLPETAFDCVGDYITAVVNAIRAPAAPAPAGPSSTACDDQFRSDGGAA